MLPLLHDMPLLLCVKKYLLAFFFLNTILHANGGDRRNTVESAVQTLKIKCVKANPAIAIPSRGFQEGSKTPKTMMMMVRKK